MAGMDHAAMGHAAPGALSFPYEFPKPGRYRIWVQVKSGGQVRTGGLRRGGGRGGHLRSQWSYLVASSAVALSISRAKASMTPATFGICSVASFQSRCSRASRTAGRVFTP